MNQASVLMLMIVAISLFFAGFTGQGQSTLVCKATASDIGIAITNAFNSGRYHYMMLIAEPYHFDTKAHAWSRITATNEWSLHPSTLPLTFVSHGNKVVPYSANFDITANRSVSNQYAIVVRTISSWVADGKEIGIEGGWAAHGKKVPPLLSEETNVLLEISNALVAAQGGNTNPLAPTTDTKRAMQYEMQQLKELNPNAEKDLREYLKAHAQSNNATSGH